MFILSANADVVPNAQQEPHDFCESGGLMFHTNLGFKFSAICCGYIPRNLRAKR